MRAGPSVLGPLGSLGPGPTSHFGRKGGEGARFLLLTPPWAKVETESGFVKAGFGMGSSAGGGGFQESGFEKKMEEARGDP